MRCRYFFLGASVCDHNDPGEGGQEGESGGGGGGGGVRKGEMGNRDWQGGEMGNGEGRTVTGKQGGEEGLTSAGSGEG